MSKHDYIINEVDDIQNNHPAEDPDTNLNEGSVPNDYSAVTDPVTGETHSLKEWSKILNIPYSTLCRRYKKGWPVDKVLHGERNKTYMPNTNYKWTRDHVDLTGKRFGKLKVLHRADTDYEYYTGGEKKREWKWTCECDCGNIIDVVQHNLTHSKTDNCGCSNSNSLIDMTGKKCGYLTVLRRADKSEAKDIKTTGALWYCECECGNKCIVAGNVLRARKDTISCGCRNKVANGLSNTRLYSIYQGMVRRCNNPEDPAYPYYGGRGIYVCDEWMSSEDDVKKNGFLRFYDWSNLNGYAEDLTIDRINNDGPYSPDNCRWVTMEEQARNRRNNHLITYKGETKTAIEWGEDVGISSRVIASRHRSGWSPEESIETPLRRKVVTNSFGESHTLSEWSVITGISSGTLYGRIFTLGWNVDIALTTGATNPEIYNHIPYGFNPFFYNPSNPGYIPVYTDILGRNYTPEEWEARQAVYFD